MPPEGCPDDVLGDLRALIAAIFRAPNCARGRTRWAVTTARPTRTTPVASARTAPLRTSATQCGGEHGRGVRRRRATATATIGAVQPEQPRPGNGDDRARLTRVVVLRKEHATDNWGRARTAAVRPTFRHALADRCRAVPVPVPHEGPERGRGERRRGADPTARCGSSPAARRGAAGRAGGHRRRRSHGEHPGRRCAGPADQKALDAENGVHHYFASEKCWRTTAGSVLRCLTNGGGGWGTLPERDVQKVLADVRATST
ncbi:hypothetical protein HBB16_21705 [Pseudonocardia sp. MCCB 268]|nr:hypothetical protein [Pseudonocardia cytotoxica]